HRARALGFNTCIIDDGWQTDDNNRGYGYCGDWETAPGKIKDMKAHVARVHEIGMKYILWYSVPLLGYHSKHYAEFKDMVLNTGMDRLSAGILDPRYKEVRDFLIGIYVKALKEWDLDGFKLDFIDTWRYEPTNAPYNEKMDIPSLENAVQTFMLDLNAALKAIKPDVMLEFRQGYIGPHMRRFGNMFRVGDCPDDYISNRVGSLDLRMTMGESAVHSDMLMWHKDEKPEIAALQIASVLFCVVQYSAKLSNLTPEMKTMSLHYLDFLREHKATLLKGELHTYEPHLLYTWAEAVGEGETIAAVYAIDKCVKPAENGVIYLVNGAEGKRILVELDGEYAITVLDCMGKVVLEEKRALSGVNSIPCPVGGMIVLKKITRMK
ncbi:MAG: alpha-galactosidase, partial [Clostridia bacterium]|nr:alpha-galactosidase [Clostridia bacterium]